MNPDYLCLSLIITSLSIPSSSALSAGDDAAYESRLARVRKILRESPLIDGHNDLPWQYRKLSNDLSAVNLRADTTKLKLVTDIPRLVAGGLGGQFWSVYIPATSNGPAPGKAVLEQIDVVRQMAAGYPHTFELALSAGDIERIHRRG